MDPYQAVLESYGTLLNMNRRQSDELAALKERCHQLEHEVDTLAKVINSAKAEDPDKPPL